MKIKEYNRLTLFLISVVIVLLNLELNVLHVFNIVDSEYTLAYDLGGLFIFLLPLPFIVLVVIPVQDKINKTIISQAILIRISENKIHAKRLDSNSSHEFTGDFSEKNNILSDAEKLSETIFMAIRACVKDSKSKIKLSPYVLLTSSEPLSKIQSAASKEATMIAGACVAHYLSDCHSDSDALRFVKDNPISSII